MSAPSGQPRVWSLWVYDRHCSLIYHADWSALHNRNAAGAATGSGGGGNERPDQAAIPSTLPLNEQAKLVYGLVFSLRNMVRKLSPQQADAKSATDGGVAMNDETMHSYSTSTYTLAHLQTPTNYTFVLFTDPVSPPTRRAPASGTGASTFSGGGGIPATGGMTTTGVLSQISRGPWVEFVARNPACLSLEREEIEDTDDDSDADDAVRDVADANAKLAKVTLNGTSHKAGQSAAKRAQVIEQRKFGIGKSVDSEAFRAAVERILAQNKLNAPRM